MNIFGLMKERRTARKYGNQPIPKKIIDKIIEAGRWGPSVHGFQPWRFVVVTNAALINEISNILVKKSDQLGLGIDRYLSLTAKTISNAPCIILVYNTNVLKEVALKLYKINRKYIRIAELSELQAVAAAIQNMILMADNHGIGSCWNTIPIFCEKRINKRVGCSDKLIAIVTLGYPLEKKKRTSRKAVRRTVQYIY